jgi:hypothetical protein
VATRLRKLKINRVDLVDRGANQYAKIALYKRDEPVTKEDMGHDYTPRTVGQILQEREARDAWYELVAALECSVREITGTASEAEMADLLAQTVEEFSAAAKKLIPQLTVAKAARDAVAELEKAGRVIASNRLTRIKDAIAALQQIVREAEPAEKEPDMADVDKRAEAAETRIKELEEKLAKQDDIAKRLEVAEARAEAAETLAKREQEAREEREYISKAARYEALPIKPEEDWRVLKAIDQMEPSVRDRALELLAAAEGQLARAGALSPVGKSGESRTGGITAWAEIDTLAKAAVSKGDAATYTAAWEQVLHERPDLYERHRKESRDRS